MDRTKKNAHHRNQPESSVSAERPAFGGPLENPRIVYRIKIKGRLDPRMCLDFEDFTLKHEGGNTLLAGPVKDQAALHGILTRVRDLNWPLLLVERLDPTEKHTSGPGPDAKEKENRQ
jgi:hypothetical protein